MNILVLHGPNLNLLGEREPEIYGTLTLDELNAGLYVRANALGMRLRILQSNHEGVLIDKLHAERRWMDGAVLNFGAYTHYAWALRDAVAAVQKPCVEVHLTDLNAREPFRRVSVLDGVVVERFMGDGAGSYQKALDFLRDRLAHGTES